MCYVTHSQELSSPGVRKGREKLMNHLTPSKLEVQGVHKVSLQFKKIIKKWNDEISQWGLFYVNQYFIKFLLTLKFIVSDKISYV